MERLSHSQRQQRRRETPFVLLTMGKARVGVRLKDAVGGGKSNNRSADLDGLTQRFKVMKQRLTCLIAALRRHHSLMVEISKSRINVSRIYECVVLKGFSPQDGRKAIFHRRGDRIIQALHCIMALHLKI